MALARAIARPPKRMIRAQAPRLLGFAAPDSDLIDAYPGLASEAAAYAAIGSWGVRSDFRYSHIWTGSAYNFTAGNGSNGNVPHDDRVAAFLDRGMRIIPILSTSDANLSTSGGRTTFAQFCAAVIARYAGRVDAFELMNEPNLASHAVAVADYVAMLQEVYPLAKAANPNCIIIAGSIAPAETGSGHQGGLAYGQYICTNASDYFDALSFHAYCEGLTWTGHSGDGWHAEYQLTGIGAALAATNRPNRPIYITEYGTNNLDDTENDQLVMIQAMANDFARRRYVADEHCQYMHRNRQAETGEQDLYGIIKANGDPKKTWHWWAAESLNYAAAQPAFEFEQNTGNQTIPAWRWIQNYDARGARDPQRLYAAFGFVNVPPAGVTISADGTITVATGTATPQIVEMTVRAINRFTGAAAVFKVTITITYPELFTNPTFAGDVSSWVAIGSGSTIGYDSGQGGALVTVAGVGGGIQYNGAAITLTSGVSYTLKAKIKAGTFAGSVNFGLEGNDAALGPLTTDYAIYSRTRVGTGVAANANVRRSTAATGTIYVDWISLKQAIV